MLARNLGFSALVVALLASCSRELEEDEVAVSQEAPLTSYAQPFKLVDLEGQGPLRLSATHVYFIDNKLGAIRRVPKNGGFVETVHRPKEGLLRDFVVDPDGLALWIVHDVSTAHGEEGGPPVSPTAGQIVRVSIAPPPPQENQERPDAGPVNPIDPDAGAVTPAYVPFALEKKFGGELARARLAVDATDVYVAANGKLVRFPKEGPFSVPETLADAINVVGVAVDANNVYWADKGSDPTSATCVQNKGKIFSRSKTLALGTVKTLASAEDCPTWFALDGTTIWFRSGAGSNPIRKVSINATSFSGGASTFASASATNPAVDAGSAGALFFATASGSGDSRSTTLKSLTKSSFPTTKTFANTKVSRGLAITSVTVDATYAYYTETESSLGISRIQRVAK